MLKKILVLALLFPTLGGCILRGGHGPHGAHRNHRTSVVVPQTHAHCVGCGHVFRGGVWVNLN